jgi:hypothetical protein
MGLQDENRHGDFFTAVLKARPEFVEGSDWQVITKSTNEPKRSIVLFFCHFYESCVLCALYQYMSYT